MRAESTSRAYKEAEGSGLAQPEEKKADYGVT